MPEVHTPQLEAILGLSALVFAVAALIFIGVEAALLYAIWRFRDRGDGREAARFTTHTRLEIAWTLVPLAVLVVVFALMLGTMQTLTAAPADAQTVGVIGHQWWWEFRYGDVVTANELHLPEGRTIQFEITSVDVIHSFWVPELAGKRDAVPGQVQHLTVTPRRAGVYGGACAEFCGVQHAWMLVRVVVEPPADFDAWLAAQRATAARRPDDPGERLFLASTCVNCHTVRGTPATGTAGPDLTHLASRAALAGGVLRNDDAALAGWIRDPQKSKPGALMPAFAFNDEQLRDLVAYLRSLR